MKCATLLSTYTCSNSTGTTCTKVAVSLPLLNNNATCSASEYVVLFKPEYDGLVTATNNAATTANNALTSANSAGSTATAAGTTANNALTTANGAVTSNTSQQDTINTLTTQLTSANAAIVALTGGGSGGGSQPNPDILQAEGVVFGLALGGMAVIWGLKHIYRLLVPAGVGHE